MATLFVNLNATGSDDGSSWNNAYTDLQDAITASQDGDQIWVADGTYKPTDGQDRSISFQLKSGVEIYGGFAGGEASLEARDIESNQTILSGDLGIADDNSDNSYHVVEASNTNSEALLDGFFITAGNADGEDSFENGGGIYSEQGNATFSNLTIFGNNTEGEGGGFYTTEPANPEVENSHQLTNIVFSNNTASASSGGGLYNNASGLVLQDVQFIENIADQRGGGLYNRVSNRVILNNVEFINNQANSGGGLYNSDNRDDDLRLTNVRFINNQADRFGGAFHNFAGSPIVTDVEFINNTSADEGGAIYVTLGSPTINGALFRSNSAEVSGGAVFVATEEREVSIVNSVFDRNTSQSGGAIYIDESNSSIINSTFANNEADNGAAIFSLLEGEERPTVTNSIFYDNQGNAIANEGGLTVVTNSIVQGGYAGDGNLDIDPAFLDSENGDLRLASSSPGIDVGNNEVVADPDPTNPPQDIVGNPRIFNNTVDLGAYEFNPTSNDSPLLEREEVLSEGEEVYRFFNSELQLQFYTADEAEKDSILNNLPQYELEGVSFIAAPNPGEQDITGISPVYRLFNSATGVHLYTISEAEKDSVVANLPNYTLEGVGYYGYDTQQEGTIPLYRFYNPSLDAHFYTPSAEERDFFVDSPDYQLEGGGDGIAFYVEPVTDI